MVFDVEVIGENIFMNHIYIYLYPMYIYIYVHMV